MGLNNPFNFLNKYFGWNSDLFTNLGQQADSPVYEDEQQDNSVGPVQTGSDYSPSVSQQDNQSYGQPEQQQAYQLPSLTQQTQDILPTTYAPALGLGTDPMNSVGMDAKWQIDPNNFMAKVDSAQKNLEAIGSGQSGDPRLNRIADIAKPVADAGAWLADQFNPDDDPLANGTDFSSSNELYDNYYASLGYDKDAQDTSTGDILKQARQSVGHLLNSGLAGMAAMGTGNDQYANLASQELEAARGKEGSYWNKLLTGLGDGVSASMANAVDPERAELGLTMDETDQQHENAREGLPAAGDELVDSWRQHSKENIDDGTLAYSNLTSNWVTGKQAKAQADAGLTKLNNYDDIQDDQIYPKRYLQLNYDYTPYLPDGASMQNMVEQDTMGIPSKIEAALRNSRENMTSYDMTIDGQTINSKDFDYDKAREWILSQKLDEVWTDPDGLELRLGDIAMDADGYVRTGWTDDGRPALIMREGDPIVFDDADEANAWLTALVDAQTYDNHHGNDMFRYDVYDPQVEYTLPSGQTLSYDQVKRIYNDSVSNDDEGTKAYDGSHGVSYDFGPLNIAKPNKAITEQHEDDWWNKYFNPMADAVPMLWDLASTSVPYISDYIAWPMALSDAYMSSINVDPWSTNPDGSMHKAVDDLSEETKEALRAKGLDPEEFQDYRTGSMSMERAAANALTPLSEKIFSDNPIKEGGEKGLTKLISMIPGIGKSPLAKGAVGVVGEGLEEIPGNIFEEGAQNGLSRSWYGDYLKGEDGDVLSDESGNHLVSQDKDIMSRIDQPEQLLFGENKDKDSRSFWDDSRDSFFGGAALGGVFGAPKTAIELHRNGILGRANEASDEIWDPTYDRWKKQYEQAYGPIEE